jgi:hypothetical protein
MKNSDSPIRIRIKGDASSLRFSPGEQLSGSVEIFPNSVIRCQGVEIRLMWYTEGKGRRDEGVIQTLTYDIKEIGPEQGFNEAFDVVLPGAPWSYAGHFINVVWVIHVKIDIPMAPDLNQEARFLLLPDDVPTAS